MTSSTVSVGSNPNISYSRNSNQEQSSIQRNPAIENNSFPPNIRTSATENGKKVHLIILFRLGHKDRVVLINLF